MTTTSQSNAAETHTTRSSVPVSVVVLAKNEADNLPRCLESLRSFDEVVVVDDGSQDETAAVARAHGARVVQHKFKDFADQRNWAHDHAGLRNDWVLHLDADEVATPELVEEIRRRLEPPDTGVAAYLLCGKLMLFGKWLKHSGSFPVWMPRLAHRGRVRFAESGHGEKFAEPAGEIRKVYSPYLHFNFSKGISDWVAKHNRYSTAEAEATIAELGGGRVDWRGLFARDGYRRRQALRGLARRMPMRPVLKFCYMYFLKLGFLDGRAGLLYCRLQAIYESMIELKVRELRRRAKGESA